MKKIIIIVLIIEIINLSLTLFVINKIKTVEAFNECNVDTVFNKLRIDSIQYNIIQKDSTIIIINNIMKDEINKADSLNNDSAVILFRQLLQELE
jgi:hypothetical protein